MNTPSIPVSRSRKRMQYAFTCLVMFQLAPMARMLKNTATVITSEKSLMNSSRFLDMKAMASAPAAGRKTIRLRMICGMADLSRRVTNEQWTTDDEQWTMQAAANHSRLGGGSIGWRLHGPNDVVH